MLILFVISIACLLALLGAGVAIARHIRTGQRARQAAEAPPPASFEKHLHAAVRYGAARNLRQAPQQSVESIAARKEWNVPSQAVEIHPDFDEQIAAGIRKAPEQGPPQRAHFAGRRVDWTHFNKDYGDLRDPHPSRPLRAATGRAASGRQDS